MASGQQFGVVRSSFGDYSIGDEFDSKSLASRCVKVKDRDSARVSIRSADVDVALSLSVNHRTDKPLRQGCASEMSVGERCRNYCLRRDTCRGTDVLRNSDGGSA